VTSRLVAVCMSANDPDRLARFWAGVLGWEHTLHTDDGVSLSPPDDTGFGIRFPLTQQPKVAQNHLHFDLTSTSLEDQHATVQRSLDLGAQHIDVGQRPEEGHVVLADPEGNEFCVIGPGNAFLADCGFIGAVAGDGSQQVGYFWSQALGWPLVWDQDQETAIRSPYGGPKLTWGGPPLIPKIGPDRLLFEIAPIDGEDPQAEADRLVSLGASHVGVRQDNAGYLLMADPDGRTFRLLPPP
jgi:catechol 2,3-dioxygenase-like lactoylglutathione lyase family enzyme